MTAVPEHLTDVEVAAILKIDVVQVQRLTRAGKIPGSHKAGRKWRYNPQVIADLGKPAPTSETPMPSVAGLLPSSAKRLRRRTAA